MFRSGESERTAGNWSESHRTEISTEYNASCSPLGPQEGEENKKPNRAAQSVLFINTLCGRINEAMDGTYSTNERNYEYLKFGWKN